VSKYPGQEVIFVCVLCILNVHVSNEKTLAVTPVSMRKVISVSILSRYYCILEGIAILNMITPGSDIVMSVYFPCVHVSNGKTLAVTSGYEEVINYVHSTRYLSLHIKKH
jgi:hypothetical protein